MVLILKDDNQFSKFLRACNNIIGGKIKISRSTTGDHGSPMTEEMFNSSSLQWQTGISEHNTAILSDDCPHPELTWSAIQTEMDRMQSEYDAKEYQRLRQGRNEYPTVEELVVALYEPEDRADIDARRLATKQKFPKP